VTKLIIESELGKRTVVRVLMSYEREHIGICRSGTLDYNYSQKAMAYAIGRLGTTYKVRQIF
jgi:hypothetical protein